MFNCYFSVWIQALLQTIQFWGQRKYLLKTATLLLRMWSLFGSWDTQPRWWQKTLAVGGFRGWSSQNNVSNLPWWAKPIWKSGTCGVRIPGATGLGERRQSGQLLVFQISFTPLRWNQIPCWAGEEGGAGGHSSLAYSKSWPQKQIFRNKNLLRDVTMVLGVNLARL